MTRDRYETLRGRPISLYASPADVAAFRPLPMSEEGGTRV